VRFQNSPHVVNSNMRKILFIIQFFSLSFIIFAHGTYYEIISRGVVGIKVSYEGGAAIAAARVRVFAPGEKKVWMETISDANGIITFCPDRRGLWVLQVRGISGHGMRINLEIDDKYSISRNNNGGKPSFLQRFIPGIAVVWAMVSTALFFWIKGKR